jgi:hypothetical protein
MTSRIEIPIEQARWRRSQIAETFASVRVSAPCYRFAEYVGFLAIVKSELKFREIQRQIFLAHAVIAAHDATFEERPERFNRIGVNDSAHEGRGTIAYRIHTPREMLGQICLCICNCIRAGNRSSSIHDASAAGSSCPNTGLSNTAATRLASSRVTIVSRAHS